MGVWYIAYKLGLPKKKFKVSGRHVYLLWLTVYDIADVKLHHSVVGGSSRHKAEMINWRVL